MNWFYLAVLSALFQSIYDIFIKHISKKSDPCVAVWAIKLSSCIVLAPFLVLKGIPHLDSTFVQLLCLTAALNVGAYIAYMRAIEKSDLSLILPLQMFTPLVVLLVSPVLIGEVPGFLGVCGVLLIVCGSYCLNLKAARRGVLLPFQMLLNNRGAQIAFGCAAVWALTISMSKLAISHSSPAAYLTLHDLLIVLLLTPVVMRKHAGSKKNQSTPMTSSSGTAARALSHKTRQPAGLMWYFLAGCAVAVCSLSLFSAISAGIVVYALAIKRTSILLSMCLGSLFFHERNLRQRLAGAMIMTAGIVLTSLS